MSWLCVYSLVFYLVVLSLYFVLLRGTNTGLLPKFQWYTERNVIKGFFFLIPCLMVKHIQSSNYLEQHLLNLLFILRQWTRCYWMQSDAFKNIVYTWYIHTKSSILFFHNILKESLGAIILRRLVSTSFDVSTNLLNYSFFAKSSQPQSLVDSGY